MESNVSASERFKVGDRCRMPAFTDCFGEYHPAREDLTVTRIRRIESDAYPTYFRLICDGPSAVSLDAHERLFESA